MHIFSLFFSFFLIGFFVFAQDSTTEYSDENYSESNGESYDSYENYSENGNENYDEFAFLDPINDNTKEGQLLFVRTLFATAGYSVKKIEIYQTLPNHAKVFRVKFENNYGSFLFLKWDKEKKENVIANKMINSGVYYNLKTARKLMREQTNLDSFGVEDPVIQAEDNIPTTNPFPKK